MTDTTPGFLAVLGVAPARGRAFEPADVGQPLAILSHAFWRVKLAGDAGVVGRTLVLGGRTHAILGVMPEQFPFALGRCDVWRPLPLPPQPAARANYRVRVVGRLAGNVAPGDLVTALDDVSRRGVAPAQVVGMGMATAIAGGARRTLGLLAGAATLAFVIAFANLAGLLVVRSIDRRRELAVRTALGASRSEVAR